MKIDHIDRLLRTLRSLPPSDPSERAREVGAALRRRRLLRRPERAAEEKRRASSRPSTSATGDRVARHRRRHGFFTWRLGERARAARQGSSPSTFRRACSIAPPRRMKASRRQRRYVSATETRSEVAAAIARHGLHRPLVPRVRRARDNDRGGKTIVEPAGRTSNSHHAKEGARRQQVRRCTRCWLDEIRPERIEPLRFGSNGYLDFLPIQHALIFTGADGGASPSTLVITSSARQPRS